MIAPTGVGNSHTWDFSLRDHIFGFLCVQNFARLSAQYLVLVLYFPCFLAMVQLKRKRLALESDSEGNLSDISLDEAHSDEDIDISTVLTGKRPKLSSTRRPSTTDTVDDDDDDLQEFIRESIAKRDVKEGTELLKKTKGKTKIVKGEVGGGSFQSMGA